MKVESKFRPLRISKGLLSLLAMLVVLLTPQGAWAEDYGLTVAGIQVTDANASHILGENDESVTFDASTNTLTLNNANFTGAVVSTVDLVVDFVGSNVITLPEEASYAFTGNGTATLTFTNSGDAAIPLTVYNIFSTSIIGGWSANSVEFDSGQYSPEDLESDWWLDSTISFEIKLVHNNKYDLWIEGTQVKEFNKDDILGNQRSVSFDPTTNTLTIDSYYSESNTTEPFVTNGLSELNIKLKGSNQIHSGPLFIAKSSTDNTDNIVTFTTDLSDSGNLIIRAHGEEGAAWSSGHTVNYANGLMKTSEYYDEEPYDANTILIELPEIFNLSVAGTQVKPDNAGNVLGDNNYSVSFDPNTNTLYLDGATINGNIETTLDNLTISVSNANTLTGNIIYNGNSQGATLTFDANLEYATNASLALSTTSQESGVISNFNTITVNSPLETTITEWNNNVKNATLTAVCYDMRVAGVLVTKANKDNVLGTPEGTNPTVTFQPAGDEPATLTLNNATIDLRDVEGSAICYTGTTALTIKLIGTNSIQTQYNCEPILCDLVSDTKPSLTFEVGSRPCSLELVTGGYTSVIQNFSSVNGVNNINGQTGNSLILSDNEALYNTENGLYTIVDQESVPVSSAMIIDFYGITVAGVPVHDGNKDNVLGTTTPTVSFTPAVAATDNTPATPAVLTLNGATINGRIFSGLEDGLTVHLLGNNVIDGGYVDANSNGEYAFVTEADYLPLTFTTDDDNPGQLLMKNTYRNGEYAQYYSGFGTVFENGLAEGYSSDKKRLITLKPVITPDEGLYWTDQEYAITGNGSGTIKYADGMNHFSETTYTAPFTMSTVGKYLLSATQARTYDGSTFEVSTSGVYIVHNKPGFSVEAGSYIGTQNVTLTNLPTDMATEFGSYPQVWYYLNDNKNDSVLYTSAEQTIAVSESTKVCVYILDEDSDKVLKSKVVEAEYTILRSLGLRFYTSENSYIQRGGSQGTVEYGEEYTAPTLKGDTGDGYTADLSNFNITYSSSDPTTATIDETGKITIVGGGYTTIKAKNEATETYAADSTWYELSVRPADPDVSISEGAYFTGQQLTLQRVGSNGTVFYSYNYSGEKTEYTEAISLPKGVYDFYPYTRSGTGERYIWSYGNAHRMLYVYDQPTISKDAGEYEGEIEVEITNLPEDGTYSTTVYYYFDDDEDNAMVYNAGDKITVRESTKLNVYLYVEGDSGKTHKTEVIERQYVIKDIPLALTDDDFHNHWATYYNNNGNVALPEDKTIGAYIASGVGENSVTVTQIKSIPKGVPVFLNNETTTTTDNTDVTGNMLRHADEDVAVSAINGMVYGLYNGMMKRVHGTISAGKNYLLIPVATQPAGAPQLTIVIDGEESVTSVNNVKNKNAEVAGQYYDLTGRKLQQKPSKDGIYLKNGRKVIVNHRRK